MWLTAKIAKHCLAIACMSIDGQQLVKLKPLGLNLFGRALDPPAALAAEQ